MSGVGVLKSSICSSNVSLMNSSGMRIGSMFVQGRSSYVTVGAGGFNFSNGIRGVAMGGSML